jgi:hypothetical protein
MFKSKGVWPGAALIAATSARQVRKARTIIPERVKLEAPLRDDSEKIHHREN